MIRGAFASCHLRIDDGCLRVNGGRVAARLLGVTTRKFDFAHFGTAVSVRSEFTNPATVQDDRVLTG